MCAGSGVAALLASKFSDHTWAADITERSTAFARFNASGAGVADFLAVAEIAVRARHAVVVAVALARRAVDRAEEAQPGGVFPLAVDGVEQPVVIRPAGEVDARQVGTGERSGMPHGIAQVRSQIDSRKNEVHLVVPRKYAEPDAICRRAVDAPGVEVAAVQAALAEVLAGRIAAELATEQPQWAHAESQIIRLDDENVYSGIVSFEIRQPQLLGQVNKRQQISSQSIDRGTVDEFDAGARDIMGIEELAEDVLHQADVFADEVFELVRADFPQTLEPRDLGLR